MNIVVYTAVLDGLGDLFFAQRLSRLLQRKYRFATIELLAGAPSHKNESQLNVELLNFNRISGGNAHPISTYKNWGNTDLIIIGPACESADIWLIKANTKNNTCVIFLPEYDSSMSVASMHSGMRILRQSDVDDHGRQKPGFTELFLYTTGLGFDSRRADMGLGVLLSDSLEYFDNALSKPKITHFNQLLAPTRQQLIFPHENPVAYLEKHDIYFCYSHGNVGNHLERFLRVQLEYARKSENSVDIIIVGLKQNPATLATTFAMLQPQISQYFNNSQLIMSHVPPPPRHTHRNYRIIYFPSLPHPDVLSLLALSNDLSGATGDQSYTEQLMARKKIIYEVRQHKIAFSENMCLLADRVDIMPEFSSCNFHRIIELLGRAENAAEYAELIALLSNDVIDKAFSVYRNYIIEDKNLWKNLEKKLDIIFDPGCVIL
jgi:hypothetical protein